MEQRSYIVSKADARANDEGRNSVSVFYRYNITTGLYPFEGDNIYKLYENIGRGEYTIPTEVEEPLKSLIEGMLQKDADKRFTLQQVKRHRWTVRKHPKTQKEVPIPPLKSNGCHSMTVLPYLMEYHQEGVDDNPVYYTEHQLNGTYVRYGVSLTILLSYLCALPARSPFPSPLPLPL